MVAQRGTYAQQEVSLQASHPQLPLLSRQALCLYLYVQVEVQEVVLLLLRVVGVPQQLYLSLLEQVVGSE
jgi:hypothetical protein